MVAANAQDLIRFVDAGAGIVISLHGIQTRGAWQKQVNSELQRNGFRHEMFDYGFFWAAQLLVPLLRTHKIDEFRKRLDELFLEDKVAPSVVAHSFGTYIVAGALEKYAELRFDRIIFCGSIVRRDYDWNSLIEAGRVGAVLNEWGGRDIWPKLAQWAVVDAGPSGALGFQSSCRGFFQRYRPKFGHSDYFYPVNYRQNWIPFLNGVDPPDDPVERKEQRNWRFWGSVFFALVALLAAYSLLRWR